MPVLLLWKSPGQTHPSGSRRWPRPRGVLRCDCTSRAAGALPGGGCSPGCACPRHQVMGRELPHPEASPGRSRIVCRAGRAPAAEDAGGAGVRASQGMFLRERQSQAFAVPGSASLPSEPAVPPPARAQGAPFVWLCFSALAVRSAALPTLPCSVRGEKASGAGSAARLALGVRVRRGSPVAGCWRAALEPGGQRGCSQSLVPHPVTLPGEHLLLILASRGNEPVLFHSFLIVSR